MTITTPRTIRVLRDGDCDEPEVRPSSSPTPAVIQAREELRSRINIANRLIKARLELGLTQQEVAKAVGTRQSRISELERIDGNPRIATLDKVARVLGLEVALQRRVSKWQIAGLFQKEKVGVTGSVTIRAKDGTVTYFDLDEGQYVPADSNTSSPPSTRPPPVRRSSGGVV